MNKLSLAGLAMTALVSSCSEDLATIGNGLQKSTIGVSVSTESTRAAFNKDGSFYWSTGDQIGVMSDKTNNVTAFSCFTLTKGEGTASAEFTGVGSGSYTYVVYPYNEGHSLSNGKLTYLFPNTYKYEKVDQTFFPTEKDGNSYNPAMWGKVGDNNNTTLKHLGGVLCVKVDKMPCQSGSVEVSADENMAGKYTATLATDDAPALKNTEDSPENPSKKVTITFSGATKDQPGVFYVPVPTGTYNNIRVKFFEGTTEKVNTVAGSYKVDRANLYALVLTENKIDAGVSTAASSVADANTKLSTSDNVAITSQVESGSTITIPAASASTSTTTKTITLEKVASGAALTVKEADGTDATTANAITISLPKPASADDAASLTITTPNSTTTIASNAGETTINKVTASTAENTLIVSDGVTIKELEIAKGNVRINKGAKVEKISLSSNASAADVYYETGASVPSEDVTNITKYEIGVGTNPIKTEAQFEAAMSKGGDYTLVADLTLAKSYYPTSTTTVDLNKKKLTVITIQVENGGNVTFKNGEIIQAGKSTSNGSDLVCVSSNGTLELDGITYSGGKDFQCIFIRQCSQTAALTIKNSKVETNNYYAVSTNASTKPEIAKDCTITLENSTFYAAETGALINIPATVTMKNCKFSGNHQGAFLRGGNYTIEDCDFTLNATLAANHSENRWMTKWLSGNQAAFAALTLGNYINDAYAYETNITFMGTNKATVTGTNAKDFPAIHACVNADYKMTISGFNDHMTISEGCKNPAVEYGTSGITVDGESKTANVTEK